MNSIPLTNGEFGVLAAVIGVLLFGYWRFGKMVMKYFTSLNTTHAEERKQERAESQKERVETLNQYKEIAKTFNETSDKTNKAVIATQDRLTQAIEQLAKQIHKGIT